MHGIYTASGIAGVHPVRGAGTVVVGGGGGTDHTRKMKCKFTWLLITGRVREVVRPLSRLPPSLLSLPLVSLFWSQLVWGGGGHVLSIHLLATSLFPAKR